MRTWTIAAAFLLAAGIAVTACEREEEGAIEFEDDTLELTIPEDTEERIERGARRVGEAVGGAIERTGEALDEAGTRMQEEIGEDEPAAEPDTIGP